MKKRLHAGQSALEYLVAAAVIVTVLFGRPNGPGSSMVEIVSSAISNGYSGFYTAVSVPN